MAPAVEDNFFSPQNHWFYAVFSHPPLDTSRQEIRLLEIDTTHDYFPSYRPPLKLISNVSVQSAPSYCALSYCCGDPNDTRTLEVDGVPFEAFSNLAKGILQVYGFWKRTFPDRSKLILWADQICINQSDNQERSHQVNFMREIYHRAENVLISLTSVVIPEPQGGFAGPSEFLHILGSLSEKRRLLRELSESADTQAWFDEELPGLSSSSRRLPRAHFSESKPRLTALFAGLFQKRAESSEKASAYAYDGPAYYTRLWVWLFILRAAASPWWRRAWTYQEFMVACRAFFLVEEHALTWQQVRTIMTTCNPEYHERITSPLQKFSKPGRMDALGARWDEPPPIDWRLVRSVLARKAEWRGEAKLSTLLDHARDCEASDLRDKIYAFSGLASRSYQILPVYGREKTVNQLMIETAKSIIVTEGRLDILLHAVQNTRLPAGRDALPSWVPDWAYKSDQSYAEYLSTSFHPKKSIWGHFSTHSTSIDFLQSPAGHILRTLGMMLTRLGPVIHDQYESNKQIFACSDWSPIVDRFYVGTVETKATARSSDEVWILQHAKVPYVLRKEHDCHVLIAPAVIRDQARDLSRVALSNTVPTGFASELRSKALSTHNPMSRIMLGHGWEADPTNYCSLIRIR